MATPIAVAEATYEELFNRLARKISKDYTATYQKEQALIKLEECRMWLHHAKPRAMQVPPPTPGAPDGTS